jgi:hypothetical protein
MTLNIVVAHKPEARGIIDGLSLKRDPNYPQHAIYAAENIKLGICGTGYQRCRAMTEILQSGSPSFWSAKGEFEYWLNYGSAGSAGFKVGELIIADTVIYPSMSRQWELSCLPGPFAVSAANQATVCTVDTVEESYNGNRVYDMEAAGMLSVLHKTGYLHRATVLKLVSDGPDLGVKDQTRKQIIELLDRAEPRVQLLVDALLNWVSGSTADSENSSNGAC